MFRFLANLFKRKELSPERMVHKTIIKMGYKKIGEGSYQKESSDGSTIISVSEKGIKIKSYFGGFAESDYLTGPVTDEERLRNFIRYNQV